MQENNARRSRRAAAVAAVMLAVAVRPCAAAAVDVAVSGPSNTSTLLLTVGVVAAVLLGGLGVILGGVALAVARRADGAGRVMADTLRSGQHLPNPDQLLAAPAFASALARQVGQLVRVEVDRHRPVAATPTPVARTVEPTPPVVPPPPATPVDPAPLARAMVEAFDQGRFTAGDEGRVEFDLDDLAARSPGVPAADGLQPAVAALEQSLRSAGGPATAGPAFRIRHLRSTSGDPNLKVGVVPAAVAVLRRQFG